MFRNNNFEIHHVMIVKIDYGINMGISFTYEEITKQVKIPGIHTDKSLLIRQHQWIDLEHQSSINHLSNGNPDDPHNRIIMYIEKGQN